MNLSKHTETPQKLAERMKVELTLAGGSILKLREIFHSLFLKLGLTAPG
jgi:hypothetical protein